MSRRLHLINLFLLMLALAAGTIVVPAAEKYIQVNLVSDQGNIAPETVPQLADPWGMARTDTGEYWIANHRDGVLVRLTGEGTAAPSESERQVITVPVPKTTAKLLPAKPTGIVYNNTPDFILNRGKPARLILATQEGAIAAWNRETGGDQAVLAVDNSSFAVYTGITIGRKDGKNYLYAADFRAGTIDVFDTYFRQVKPREGDSFVDPMMPAGYAPFNVQYIDGKLYVLYAFQDAGRYDPEPGVGARYISVYDMDGKLLMRLEPGQSLNSAWAISVAPSGFGSYSNMLLVGNSANGTIAAVDPVDGTFRGFLEKEDGYLVTIPGLRGMAFARTGRSREPDRLYFCAGIAEGEHGLFGFIRPEP